MINIKKYDKKKKNEINLKTLFIIVTLAMENTPVQK